MAGPDDDRLLLRDVRGDVRHWRRGRSDARLADVIGDIYTAVFSALVLGSMVVNVVVNVGRVSDELCTSTGCREARSLLPWLVGALLVAGALALARMLGPVSTSPAVGSWLATAPLSRRLLLRRRLVATLAAALAATAVLAAGTGVLGGFGAVPALLFALVLGLLALLAVATAGAAQARRSALPRVLAWAAAGVVWLGLLAMATDRAPLLDTPQDSSPLWYLAVATAGVLALVATVAAYLALPRLRARDLSVGGALLPSVSGALAGLDLSLLHDVLLAHRWRRHEAVRPRRSRVTGLGALVWTDLVRLGRSPSSVVVLAATVVVPYAAAASGAGRVTVLLGGLAGFLALLPLLTGLRVLSRTPGLARMLPWSTATARLGQLVVPGTLALALGLGTAPALREALAVGWGVAVLAGLAVGASVLAAAVRWVTGRPPDYGRPLISSPAGAVPTNLYGSVVRGFDILLVGTGPLLLSPDATGAMTSILLCAGVLGYLAGRRDRVTA